MTTVRTGKHTYDLLEDWAKLPKNWTLGQTGIVTDARLCGTIRRARKQKWTNQRISSHPQLAVISIAIQKG